MTADKLSSSALVSLMRIPVQWLMRVANIEDLGLFPACSFDLKISYSIKLGYPGIQLFNQVFDLIIYYPKLLFALIIRKTCVK